MSEKRIYIRPEDTPQGIREAAIQIFRDLTGPGKHFCLTPFFFAILGLVRLTDKIQPSRGIKCDMGFIPC